MGNAGLSCAQGYYFSQRLIDLLRAVIDAPVTLIEAPAGYGKSTALRRIEELHGNRADIFWFTGLSEDQQRSWDQFRAVVSRFDPASGALLQKIDHPNRVNSHRLGELISQLSCGRDTILLLDNFQVWQPELDTPIIQALLRPGCEKLHIVIATQYLTVPDGLSGGLYELKRVSTADLTLTAQDIRAYFSGCCPKITMEEAEEVFRNTEGWPAAVSLCLRGCRLGRLPRGEQHVGRLLCEVFFDRISQREREMFFLFALFDAITDKQLAQVFPEASPSYVSELARRAPLIRYDAFSGVYYPHDLLQRFLRLRLEGEPQDLRRRICLEAGAQHMRRGNLVRALTCFYAVRAYEEILALPLVNLCFAKIGDVPFEDVAREILNACPRETLLKYPLSLLRLAYFLFASTDFAGYGAAMALARLAAEQSGEKAMLGEWMVMDALSVYPDVRKMGLKWKIAWETLGRRCGVIPPQEPFMFGCQSMWFMFYTAPGRGDQTALDLQEALVYYNRLTDGHAGGADTLYRAELAYLRDEYDDAQRLAYQAAHLAQVASQPTVSYGAALLLGRVAIIRQDMKGLEDAVRFLENKAAAYPFMQGSEMNRHMLDITRCMLRSMMGEANRIPAWVQDGLQQPGNRGIASLMTIYAYISLKISQKDFNNALGTLDAMLSQDKRISSLALEYYAKTAAAICNLELQRSSGALLALDRALEIAGPDSLTAIFVHYREQLKGLMYSSALLQKHGTLIAKVMNAKKKKPLSGAASIAEELGLREKPSAKLPAALEGKLPENLTEREREAALLAAQGFRNREIAERMFISEQTVKNHLRSVFEKLSIDRRTKLTQMLKP